MLKYASLIYNGFWFSLKEKCYNQQLINLRRMYLELWAKLYKGHVIITGRKSPFSLYNESLVSFEDGPADYNHSDAEGFIKLNALRLRVKKLIDDTT